MKTILEWYEELNQPYRILAIHNYDKHFSYCNEAGSLAEALSGGFSWTDSPERFEYWNNLYDELSKPTPNPMTPLEETILAKAREVVMLPHIVGELMSKNSTGKVEIPFQIEDCGALEYPVSDHVIFDVDQMKFTHIKYFLWSEETGEVEEITFEIPEMVEEPPQQLSHIDELIEKWECEVVSYRQASRSERLTAEVRSESATLRTLCSIFVRDLNQLKG